jgi:hypothetical protein
MSRAAMSAASTKLDDAAEHLRLALYPSGDETEPRLDLPEGVGQHLTTALRHIGEAKGTLADALKQD